MIYYLPHREYTKEVIQTFVDVNGKPHSIWEDMVEWVIDSDVDKSFDEWLESYKKKYYPLTAKESYKKEGSKNEGQ